MTAINSAFLVSVLVLQLVLLALLFARRMSSQLIMFTALLCFYVVRSLLLFTLFHRISGAAYNALYTDLSVVDLFLQVAVGLEISLAVLRSGSKPFLPRAMVVPSFFLLAAGFTGVAAAILPAHSPAPADRGIIFTGLLFMQLGGWALTSRLSPWGRSVAGGLAVVGMAGILTQSAKSIAAFHRNAHEFLFWSYSNAGVYLLLLLFWIWRSKSCMDRPAKSTGLDADRNSSRHKRQILPAEGSLS